MFPSTDGFLNKSLCCRMALGVYGALSFPRLPPCCYLTGYFADIFSCHAVSPDVDFFIRQFNP
jgi:hypothetical protein